MVMRTIDALHCPGMRRSSSTMYDRSLLRCNSPYSYKPHVFGELACATPHAPADASDSATLDASWKLLEAIYRPC